MFKLPKNKWFWIPFIIWSSIVIFGEFFLGNLIYSAFIQKLATYGIQESDMISALIHVGLPLVLIAVGFFVMFFCFRKAVSTQVAKELSESTEFVVSPQMRTIAKLADTFSPRLNNSIKDSRSEWKANQEASLAVDVMMADRRRNMELDRLEDTRLYKWFSFLDLKICQGKKYWADPLLKYEKYLEYFEQVHEGFKTALEDKTKFYRWVSELGWENKRIKEEFQKMGVPEKHVHLQNLITKILNCLYEFRTTNPTNDSEFREKFNGDDLKRYGGEKCP
jgi:hypothetical protein